MRERRARWLAVLTGLTVVLLSAVHARLQNPPAGTRAGESSRAAADPALARGRAVFDESGCARCHSIAGAGSPRSPLDGVGSRLSAAEIRNFVLADAGVQGGLSPRAIEAKRRYAELPAGDLDALVGYLAALK